MHPALAALVADGPVRFDRFQHEALYGSAGFYTDGGAAGRGADFVTAVELGSEFAECVARDLDRRWIDAGRPYEFVVVEGGSGVGSLCAQVFMSRPMCVDALRWVMVEASRSQREVAMARLASEVFADRDDLPVAIVGDVSSMRLSSRADVVLANELLDNLPVRVVRRGERWEELHVGERGGEAVEVWRELDGGSRRRAERHGAGLGQGAEFPLVDHAVKWVVTAMRVIADGGALIVFDYGGTTGELADRADRGWLRTYEGHSRGTDPLENFGVQDITSDVAFDQLPGRPVLESQAEWMSSRGLMSRRADAASLVDVTGTDAAALKARSALREFDVLLDLEGIGGFSVGTWNV